jgi:hypothetical protein
VKFAGKEPVKRFKCKSNDSMVGVNRYVGILPVNVFSCKNKVCNLDKFLNSLGMDPVNLFISR